MTAKATALFCAAMSTALALGPALAHLLELPNKIGLDRESYFTVQRIYRGWSLLGLVLLAQLLSIVAVLVLDWRTTAVRRLTILALACLLAAQALFWIWTFPANRATANWTAPTVDWERLRVVWEFSHAGGALLQLVAMACLIAAALASSCPRTRPDGR